MDLDVDMGDVFDVAPEPFVGNQSLGDDILQPDDAEEPGEVAEDEPARQAAAAGDDGDDGDDADVLVPTKVHVRGLDNLHTDDVRNFVKAHFGLVDRVEWIDDTSANLLFSSEGTARDALVALSSIDIGDVTALPPRETLPAKPLDDKPGVSLSVRLAVRGDRKQAGAALRSRYYLLHPEHDPEEHRRRQRYRQRDGGDRDRDRGRDRDRDYGRRRRLGSRRRDSDGDEAETFEASMYDDAPTARPRRSSDVVHSSSRSHARENHGKELFAGRASRRDRSASPLRDRDGDEDMDSLGSSSSANRVRARSLRGRISREDSSYSRTSNRAKELFPSKSTSSVAGRLDGLEAAIGSAVLKDEDRPKVAVMPGAVGADQVFNIRGLASQRQSAGGGFTIKGAASAQELFPAKLGSGNAGKELFEVGRPKRRQKAEDLFL